MDYKHYRLNNDDELLESKIELGDYNFDKFMNKVYGCLLRLIPGQTFQIENRVTDVNRKHFIRMSCQFILEQRSRCYVFNSEYNQIKRQR